MKKITTVILAAGKSTRFKSNRSKIFHEISDRPVLDYVFSLAKKISKENIVIVCNKDNQQYIKKHYQKCKIAWQKNIKGTAEAVLKSKQYIPRTNDILILFGDVPFVKENTIKRLIKSYRLSKNKASMLAFNAKNPFGYGRVETKGKNVIRVTEELNADNTIRKIPLCNSGIMLCNYNLLFSNIDKISDKNAKKEKYLTDLFYIAYQANKSFVFSICAEDELQGINTREELSKADASMQKILKSKLMNKGVTILQPDTVRVSYDTKIGKDSIIEAFVIIKKGVTLGNNIVVKSHSVIESCKVGNFSTIGPSARIRPKSIIGTKVKIGNFVEIKNSVIGNSTSISHLSYIGDSQLGKRVNIGAGTITCNFDGKNKNKTIIKDNVFIGSNTSLIAPITIKENAIIGAGSVITKNIPSNSLAIERSPLKIVKKYTKHR